MDIICNVEVDAPNLINEFGESVFQMSSPDKVDTSVFHLKEGDICVANALHIEKRERHMKLHFKGEWGRIVRLHYSAFGKIMKEYQYAIKRTEMGYVNAPGSGNRFRLTIHNDAGAMIREKLSESGVYAMEPAGGVSLECKRLFHFLLLSWCGRSYF